MYVIYFPPYMCHHANNRLLTDHNSLSPSHSRISPPSSQSCHPVLSSRQTPLSTSKRSDHGSRRHLIQLGKHGCMSRGQPFRGTETAGICVTFSTQPTGKAAGDSGRVETRSDRGVGLKRNGTFFVSGVLFRW